ncbi:hypothetical protein ACOSQ2_012731 [Xanthoceras sorbifolium]
MVSTIRIVTFFHILLILLSSKFGYSEPQTWVRAGYYYWFRQLAIEFAISDINSAFFTHLVCGFAEINSTSYELSLSPLDEQNFTNFTGIVQLRNPSVTTLLSIGGWEANVSPTFSSLASSSSYRKYFIDDSIKIARLYGFQGLELSWAYPNTSSDMLNLGILLKEWREAISLEANNSNRSELILTAMVYFSPRAFAEYYPIDAMQKYLNWVHIKTEGYTWPVGSVNTNFGISQWIDAGLSAKKMVMHLPYYGYAWTLVNVTDNGIGAPARGSAITNIGAITYKNITRNYVEPNGANVMYNATYVVNYCAIRTKVSYAKEKGLLGYVVWQVSFDNNWVLSQAKPNKPRLLLTVFTSTGAAIFLLLGSMIYCSWWMRKLKSKGMIILDSATESNKMNNMAATGKFNSNFLNLKLYSFIDVETATNIFSFEKKLGEGGYGPVYKEVAVNKLSKTSTQGFEEFKNEVILTVKLQHINLVRVLGFCIDREEQMLIYEYMPNKSLDHYLFDPVRRYILDWRKRVHIIEGVTQGLLYLQEYSRYTIIHRDLKASNALLDKDIKPKISDFGMVIIFAKDDLEANTGKIYIYVLSLSNTVGMFPPEYVKKGIYSIKSDVYSFGVRFLQILSGKRVSSLYGENENLTLLEYGYELWKDKKSMEFIDPSLDDTCSTCKLERCLQIALLCVQESSNDRPSVLEVSSLLNSETTDIMIPNKPAFSKQIDAEYQRNKHTNSSKINSVNDVTVSELFGR